MCVCVRETAREKERVSGRVHVCERARKQEKEREGKKEERKRNRREKERKRKRREKNERKRD